MTWEIKELKAMKKEFVRLALKEASNKAELCRRYGISRTCGNKWIKRYQQEGEAGLEERSRKRKSQSGKTAKEVEAVIIGLRDKHPGWGARKLKRRLEDLGYKELPARSTINDVLQRNGRIESEHPSRQGPWKRFCNATPNDLWQMDFKGQFLIEAGKWCFPFTAIDDHSRYVIGLEACADQKNVTVKQRLIAIFERFGLPKKILADNGNPWGCSHPIGAYTALEVWLLQLGVELIHGKPYHPQTQGKIERFHRTLELELLAANRQWKSFEELQNHFDDFRYTYNTQRPHEALELDVPEKHYVPSLRSMPKSLPAIEYLENDEIRKVLSRGNFNFKGHKFYLGEAFAGLPIALRPCATDGCYDLFFSWKKLTSINLSSIPRSSQLYHLDI